MADRVALACAVVGTIILNDYHFANYGKIIREIVIGLSENSEGKKDFSIR